jgi:hypothetical protein
LDRVPAKVQIGNMPAPVETRIRVTEIFCRIDGDRKMIHRHADLPKSEPDTTASSVTPAAR